MLVLNRWTICCYNPGNHNLNLHYLWNLKYYWIGLLFKFKNKLLPKFSKNCYWFFNTFSRGVPILSVYAILLLNVYCVNTTWVASAFVNQKTKSFHFVLRTLHLWAFCKIYRRAAHWRHFTNCIILCSSGEALTELWQKEVSGFSWLSYNDQWLRLTFYNGCNKMCIDQPRGLVVRASDY